MAGKCKTQACRDRQARKAAKRGGPRRAPWSGDSRTTARSGAFHPRELPPVEQKRFVGEVIEALCAGGVNDPESDEYCVSTVRDNHSMCLKSVDTVGRRMNPDYVSCMREMDPDVRGLHRVMEKWSRRGTR